MASDVRQYIPQREPIIMISDLVSADEKVAVSELIITNENIFAENGVLTESGIIENIAQTAAAMTGYNAVNNNKSVKKGYIGSVNKLEVFQLPKVGTTISTRVEIESEVMNVNIIKGSVFYETLLLAECEMRIFLEE